MYDLVWSIGKTVSAVVVMHFTGKAERTAIQRV
jgi:hypothetical protein